MKFVDPKVLLANERTYLSWIRMAVTMGGVGAALMAASSDNSKAEAGPEDDGDISPGSNSSWFLGAILLPVALVFAAYALRVFLNRDGKIRKSELSQMPDDTMALVMGGVLATSLFGVIATDLLTTPLTKI